MIRSSSGENVLNLLLIGFIQLSLSNNITEDGIVSIEAKSIGCDEDHGSTSIVVNHKEYSNRFDGVHIVAISPNGSVAYKSFTIQLMRECKTKKPLCLVKKKIFTDFFLKLENGTVAIVTTQNICSSEFYNWLLILKLLENLKTGVMNFNIHYHTLILIGCYGYCPERIVSGTMPYNKLSTKDQEVKLQYSFKDFHPFLTSLPSPFSPKEQRKSTNHSRSYIVAFIFFPLIIVLTCIAQVCIKHRRRVPENLSVPRGRIQSDAPSGQYTGLNLKRPSAFPNTYEELQKMSGDYEEVESPSHFLKNELNLYLYLLPDYEEENKYYVPTSEGDIPGVENHQLKSKEVLLNKKEIS